MCSKNGAQELADRLVAWCKRALELCANGLKVYQTTL